MTSVTNADEPGDYTRTTDSCQVRVHGGNGVGADRYTASRWIAEIEKAADECTESAELSTLAHGHVWARWGVASNPACPASLLRVLASDDVPLVRRAAAQNPNTPREVRQRLMHDSDKRVGLDLEISEYL